MGQDIYTHAVPTPLAGSHAHSFVIINRHYFSCAFLFLELPYLKDLMVNITMPCLLCHYSGNIQCNDMYGLGFTARPKSHPTSLTSPRNSNVMFHKITVQYIVFISGPSQLGIRLRLLILGFVTRIISKVRPAPVVECRSEPSPHTYLPALGPTVGANYQRCDGNRNTTITDSLGKSMVSVYFNLIL
jgi:hypothetical protein